MMRRWLLKLVKLNRDPDVVGPARGKRGYTSTTLVRKYCSAQPKRPSVPVYTCFSFVGGRWAARSFDTSFVLR